MEKMEKMENITILTKIDYIFVNIIYYFIIRNV